MKKQKTNSTIDFAQLADKQVGGIYLLMSLFLTIAYALEVAEGSQPPGFLVAFIVADWGPLSYPLSSNPSQKGRVLGTTGYFV